MWVTGVFDKVDPNLYRQELVICREVGVPRQGRKEFGERPGGFMMSLKSNRKVLLSSKIHLKGSYLMCPFFLLYNKPFCKKSNDNRVIELFFLFIAFLTGTHSTFFIS